MAHVANASPDTAASAGPHENGHAVLQHVGGDAQAGDEVGGLVWPAAFLL
jgi:hypothetical protein